ncbi:MAG: hypothetical protein UR69_C0001G0263 [Candidatus Moranbacteria bacterium GW2011_GWE2_35_2-]|nr:MAG: hypothetical protein UR69_C0001G0263 [Candidatus Moranbacteria bacterium GW2011_GWE2_35_2-]KKQ04060.1 MAG: hypothetical protein US15_C0069G0004 [Candidatus Moranbacteria bacterium GW2011_GWF1_36_4]KKQ22739.1 MAG: hypothetical protein US37_C0001G0011 [Candidatus Moranbacteria bacterium GW2011_GWF2_37_11]KKQ28893.1 MAG: hypothetical protein US44_C0005G0035 [Candidatus Moranbacteria bacterium GW2011_GWD1_37_17]KKQ31030.1 MAG: hypothetical protein US47_C0001G0263 [Candidatus Moranbacteria b
MENSNGEKEIYEKILTKLDEIGSVVEKQDQRISLLESRLNAGSNFVDVAQEKESASFAPTPPSPTEEVSQPIKQVSAESSDERITLQEESASKEESDLEGNIGGKWFARIGITALVLGVSFLLKYAFDNNWIGETGRVLMGIMIGMSLLVAGEKYIRKYFSYGQIITGGGIAILYLSVFAAFDFYSLLGPIASFFGMILVTAVGIVLSLRYNAISLMTVAILGGFSTPLLISTGQNNQFSLFFYIFILDVAILVISFFRKWRALNFIGFAGTGILFFVWGASFYTQAQLGSTMFFLTLFFFIYTISSLIYNIVRQEKSEAVEQILLLLSGTTYFIASYSLMNGQHHSFMGFFALILGIYYFSWAYLVKYLTPEDDKLYGFLAFLTIGFATLVIPIQFQGVAITSGWLIEAILLFLIAVKNKEQVIIKSFGLLIFGLAIFRIFMIDVFYSSHSVLANKFFFTALFAIVISYAAAFLFSVISSDEEKEKPESFLAAKQIAILMFIVANFLTIFTGSREINNYYQNKIDQVREESRVAIENDRVQGNALNSASTVAIAKYDHTKIKGLQSRNSVILSIFWLLYGIILVAVGMTRGRKGVRVGGLILLFLAILKLFFVDLWSLGTLYRIISSMTLGVILLGISFAYNRYKDKIKEII